ncbi:Hypothetical protein A7982_10718 [Minicystis rosea]|nr:Hypothetical protein A7982_10718 [Minicystis rosea]
MGAPPGVAPPGYAPPGYAPPGYPPGAYAPYAPSSMTWTPAFETARRSSTMMGLGITLMVVGGTGIIIGSSMFAAGNQENFDYYPCTDDGSCSDIPALIDDKALKKGGIAVLVIGAAAVVAGLPLTIIGSQRVPVKAATSAFLPEPHGNGLRWRF